MGKSVPASANPVIKFQYRGGPIRNMGKSEPANANPGKKFQNSVVPM